MIRLDIFSDPVCPWCLIGATSLFKAIEAAGNPFEIFWQPFMLNPDMAPEGQDRRAYMDAKFGADRVDAMNARLTEHAAGEGLTLDPTVPPRSVNTLDAHRLILWAGIEGVQTPVARALKAAYWQEGADISDAEVLADIADSFEMDAAMVRRLLASDADRDEIRARDAEARKIGVTGVPMFIIDQRQAVSGAQPAALWHAVITEIFEKEGAA